MERLFFIRLSLYTQYNTKYVFNLILDVFNLKPFQPKLEFSEGGYYLILVYHSKLAVF